jgi:hypothetical protein
MFKRLFISSFACAGPLTWWHIHEGQFLNVGSFTKQILGILSSQIEIEQVFNFVGVLTSLMHYHL